MKEAVFYGENAAFHASNGRLKGFRKLRNIRYIASRGTTDTIDKTEANLQVLLDQIIKNNGLPKYDARDIFNLDQTALFWHILAKRGFGGQVP